MYVYLGGVLKVASQRFTVKFSHQRTDGYEETAGLMQAHAYLHTQESLGMVCTVPGRTNTQFMHAHSHISLNTPLRFRACSDEGAVLRELSQEIQGQCADR